MFESQLQRSDKPESSEESVSEKGRVERTVFYTQKKYIFKKVSKQKMDQAFTDLVIHGSRYWEIRDPKIYLLIIFNNIDPYY